MKSGTASSRSFTVLDMGAADGLRRREAASRVRNLLDGVRSRGKTNAGGIGCGASQGEGGYTEPAAPKAVEEWNAASPKSRNGR
ncbi:hypothetical protein [Paenibacillus sp. J31TS4]|uniref:hypothetical protein n=1 Tax=Paenibacillus sp. J31TS4 TaxID=2807195 RepID=UPI001BCC056A|nr:hypothetical protein [Paenibacillus sp. J31TS4]